MNFTSNRARLAIAGLLALLCSGLLSPPALGGPGGVATAVGRSMGGLRVLLVDLLFLRAEGLTSQGQLPEAASLYSTILELDPANDGAAALLVDVYATHLLPLATSETGRLWWWNESHALARRALELKPDSPLLHYRIAQLLYLVAEHHPEILPAVERAVPGRRNRA